MPAGAGARKQRKSLRQAPPFTGAGIGACTETAEFIAASAAIHMCRHRRLHQNSGINCRRVQAQAPKNSGNHRGKRRHSQVQASAPALKEGNSLKQAPPFTCAGIGACAKTAELIVASAAAQFNVHKIERERDGGGRLAPCPEHRQPSQHRMQGHAPNGVAGLRWTPPLGTPFNAARDL